MYMPRQPEPELMDDAAEALAYAAADFSDVNQAFADRLAELAGPLVEAEAADLGTGPGDIPIRVARARPRWHITALDAAPAMPLPRRMPMKTAIPGNRLIATLSTHRDEPPKAS